MDSIHDTSSSSIGYPALLDLLRKLPPRENTQPINIIYGETIVFEDLTANYGLDEFVERVNKLKEKLEDKPKRKKRKTQRSIIVIAEDEEDTQKKDPDNSLELLSTDAPSPAPSHKQTNRPRRNTSSQKTQKKQNRISEVLDHPSSV
jgi:hypothetical protein